MTHAAAYDGGQLGAVLDRDNTASDVSADTAYRSAGNLALLERRGLKPQSQRKKPRGKKMPAHIARGNASRTRVRSRVEHVLAAQKCRLGLVVRTVGMLRSLGEAAATDRSEINKRVSGAPGSRRRKSPSSAALSSPAASNPVFRLAIRGTRLAGDRDSATHQSAASRPLHRQTPSDGPAGRQAVARGTSTPDHHHHDRRCGGTAGSLVRPRHAPEGPQEPPYV
jgi:hypothetical protein